MEWQFQRDTAQWDDINSRRWPRPPTETCTSSCSTFCQAAVLARPPKSSLGQHSTHVGTPGKNAFTAIQVRGVGSQNGSGTLPIGTVRFINTDISGTYNRQYIGIQRFADADGRIRASFELVWLSGWAPHESQQKPLQPGSAKMRLADALNTKETKLE